MKKLFVVILSAILCLCLVSCAAKNNAEDTSAESTKADTIAADTTKKEEEATTEAPFDWESAAVSVLAEYADTSAQYSLYDMNGDKIPEIIVLSGESSAQMRYLLYDLTKKDAEPIAFGGGSSLLCGYEGTDIILQYGKMGEETVTKYSYDGETLKEEILISREVPVGEDYIGFTGLASFGVNDLSGLSWNENPAENNAQLLQSVK